VPDRAAGGGFLKQLRHVERPVIVLIGDDDHAPTGPNGWRCAGRLARWGKAATVHGAGGEPVHYEMAVKS
jgi:hypothetical protein